MVRLRPGVRRSRSVGSPTAASLVAALAVVTLLGALAVGVGAAAGGSAVGDGSAADDGTPSDVATTAADAAATDAAGATENGATGGNTSRDDASEDADATSDATSDAFAVAIDPNFERQYLGERVGYRANATAAVERFEWSFDGEQPSTAFSIDDSTGFALHEFDEPGEYEVRVTAVAANHSTATGPTNETSTPTSNESAANETSADGPAVNGTAATNASIATASTTVTVVEPDGPGARLVPSKAQPIAGEPLRFVWGAVDDDATATELRFDDGTTVAEPETITFHRYGEAGNYTAELTVETPDGEVVTETTTVAVRPDDDSAPLNASFDIEAGESTADGVVRVDANATAGEVEEYWWEWGDGMRSSGSDPTRFTVYPHDATYEITLTVVGENATDSATREVTVGTPPEDGATAALEVETTNATVGESIWLSAGESAGNVESYEWTAANETWTTDSYTTTVAFDEPGPQTVGLEIHTHDGATDATTRTVEVSPRPTLSAAFDVVPAAGDETAAWLLPAPTVGEVGRYEWTFGDGTNVTRDRDDPMLHEFDEPGEYAVELRTVGRYGQTDATNRTVAVPRANASAPVDAAVTVENGTPTSDEPTTFSADVSADGPVLYRWAFGDGTTLNTTSPTVEHTYYVSGDYDVTLTAIGQNGTATANANVTVYRPLAPTIHVDGQAAEEGFDDPPAVGETVTLRAYSPRVAEQYRWNVSGERTVNRSRWFFDHRFGEPGEHAVELTVVDEFGNEATAEVTVPVRDADLDAGLAVEDATPHRLHPTTFDAGASTGRIETYRFAFGDGTTLNATTPTVEHAYDEVGNYTARLTVVDEDGATNATNATVRVRPLDGSGSIVTGVYANDTSPDVDEAVQFTAWAGGTWRDLVWEFGSDERPVVGGFDEVHSFEESGTHEVTLYAVGEGTVDRANVTVEVGDDGGSGGIPAPSGGSDGGSGVGDGDDAAGDEDDAAPAEFVLRDVSFPTSIEPYADARVGATVENVGGRRGTTAPVARIGEHWETASITLDPGERGNLSFHVAAPATAGEFDASVETEDDAVTGQTFVVPAGDGGDEGSSDGSDPATAPESDTDDDGTPGFGPLAALAGVLGALALARRRSA